MLEFRGAVAAGSFYDAEQTALVLMEKHIILFPPVRTV